jgi:DNA-directed RNA polymerase specialized sigma24 family protein
MANQVLAKCASSPPVMTSETLEQFLATLPAEERIILTLHYVKDVSPQAIATMLNVPERAVTHVIAIGRARLTARLNL